MILENVNNTVGELVGLRGILLAIGKTGFVTQVGKWLSWSGIRETYGCLKNAGLPQNEDNVVSMFCFLKLDTKESISFGHVRNFMNLWFQVATVIAVAPPLEVHTGCVLKSALAGGLACTRVQASTISFPEMIAKLPEVSHGLQSGIFEASKTVLIIREVIHGGIKAASSVTRGCEVDGAVIGVCWGDKDGEDVILDGDDSGVVWIYGASS
ncbi:hypothetical protein Tco_0719231 [Tanacetum coccineum]